MIQDAFTGIFSLCIAWKNIEMPFVQWVFPTCLPKHPDNQMTKSSFFHTLPVISIGPGLQKIKMTTCRPWWKTAEFSLKRKTFLQKQKGLRMFRIPETRFVFCRKMISILYDFSDNMQCDRKGRRVKNDWIPTGILYVFVFPEQIPVSDFSNKNRTPRDESLIFQTPGGAF